MDEGLQYATPEIVDEGLCFSDATKLSMQFICTQNEPQI